MNNAIAPTLGQRVLEHSLAPVALTIAADLSFVMMDSCVQLLQARGMPASQVLTGRMWINAVLSLAYYTVNDRRSLARIFSLASNGHLRWFRGFINAMCIASVYKAVGYLAISDMMTIISLRPLTVAIVCWYWLGETVTRVQMVTIGVSFPAVLLVIQPEFLFQYTTFTPIGRDSPWGKAIGVGCSFAFLVFASIDFLICRILKDVSPGEMLFHLVFAGSICGPLWMVVAGDDIDFDPRILSWVILLGLTTCGIGAQMSLVMALSRSKAATIAILCYFQIVFGSIFQILLWGVAPNLIEVVGMSVIVAAGVWSILYGTPQVAKDEADGPLLPAPIE